jgi:hypothetical protein
VNFTSPVSYLPARSRPAPTALLGPDHPLVRDLQRVALLRKQASIVAAVFAGSVAALYEGSSAAIALMLATAVTQLLLACRAVVLLAGRRAHVLELISEGRAELPIPTVERMCVRLRQERHRRRLVRSIDALLEGETGRFDVVTTPWRFNRADLIVLVRHELAEIGARLQDDRAGLAGIAMMERLLFDGTSSLHGNNLRLLEDDLRRARFLLTANRA